MQSLDKSHLDWWNLNSKKACLEKLSREAPVHTGILANRFGGEVGLGILSKSRKGRPFNKSDLLEWALIASLVISNYRSNRKTFSMKSPRQDPRLSRINHEWSHCPNQISKRHLAGVYLSDKMWLESLAVTWIHQYGKDRIIYVTFNTVTLILPALFADENIKALLPVLQEI